MEVPLSLAVCIATLGNDEAGVTELDCRAGQRKVLAKTATSLLMLVVDASNTYPGQGQSMVKCISASQHHAL